MLTAELLEGGKLQHARFLSPQNNGFVLALVSNNTA